MTPKQYTKPKATFDDHENSVTFDTEPKCPAGIEKAEMLTRSIPITATPRIKSSAAMRSLSGTGAGLPSAFGKGETVMFSEESSIVSLTVAPLIHNNRMHTLTATPATDYFPLRVRNTAPDVSIFL